MQYMLFPFYNRRNVKVAVITIANLRLLLL